MHLIISISLLLLVALPATAQNTMSPADYLQRLDDVVDSIQTYHAAKREQLSRMQTLGKSIVSEPDRYLHNTEIYDECFTFDSELAMQVVKENLTIAQRRQDQESVYEWRIKESFILASTGQFLEAVESLLGINASALSHRLQMRYYEQMQYLYIRT